MAMIEIKNLTKRYGEKTVYQDFNLSIEDNKILAVLGESGSGKTTLLNCLANLTDYEGEITGEITPVSMAFREERLIPNLTVAENIKLVCPEVDVKAELEKVGLNGEENAYPKTLSAGMAKRVALVRAFSYKSKLLLMDEPFANLDISLKFSMINAVKKMQENNPRTVVAVTHDVKEAVTLADRIVLLANGKIIYDNSNICAHTENELYALLLKERN